MTDLSRGGSHATVDPDAHARPGVALPALAAPAWAEVYDFSWNSSFSFPNSDVQLSGGGPATLVDVGITPFFGLETWRLTFDYNGTTYVNSFPGDSVSVPGGGIGCTNLRCLSQISFDPDGGFTVVMGHTSTSTSVEFFGHGTPAAAAAEPATGLLVGAAALVGLGIRRRAARRR